jgi:hypothetical protein
MHFVFKITLENTFDPPVWRRVSVPVNFSFHKLHLVIQASFGWYNCHLYQFSEKGYGSGYSIAVPSVDDFMPVRNSAKIKLGAIFTTPKQKYKYIYDFGDDWIHKIVLEKTTNEESLKAILIKGKGACPPEDCGGPWGYARLKEILADVKDPEHEEMIEWLGLEPGEQWDAAAFNLEETQKLVVKV